MKLKTLGLCLAASATLAGCGGGFDDYAVAGPVAPPAKPIVRTYEPIIVSESEFLAAAGTNTIFFDTDKAVLTPQARDVLDRQARWLVTHREVAFRVEGHCDERGTNEYNLALGDRRASAVRDYLVSLGIPVSRVNTVSRGEESPFCSESDESCWSRNRRGNFMVTAK